jgi:CO dehydrogenase/acetyl-CoA synthase gamma subunit (corrinoid Fe-S protein)
MSTTQADIDRLNAAIAREERQVTIGGETVVYRSTADLIRARDDMQVQLARENGATRRRKITRLEYAGRGY